MSKAILMSIQPKWCELIASGKKTVEVRKSKPKLEPPFKVYIYCTKGKLALLRDDGDTEEKYKYDVWEYAEFHQRHGNKILGGKVIGEFVCDSIIQIDYNKNGYGLDAIAINGVIAKSCIPEKELYHYLQGKKPYLWHISNLIIYDEPKELSEFVKYEKCPYAGAVDCSKCIEHHCLKRPPQSWCYVEERRADG